MTTLVLWLVYAGLLLVLLPHTAWAFKNWEPPESQAVVLAGSFTSSDLVSYIAAFAFESAIAALTHKLAKHIETTPKKKLWYEKAIYRYLNPIAFGLVIATAVSALANLAHAVQFGQQLKIFTEWRIPFALYSIAFGGVLPFVSLIFARVLSNVTDDEEGPNPAMEEAKAIIAELRAKVKAAEVQAKTAEQRAQAAEDRFAALGDVVKYLFGPDKRQRIVFARRTWQNLPASAIAVIAEASPSYVSEVLKDSDQLIDIPSPIN